MHIIFLLGLGCLFAFIWLKLWRNLNNDQSAAKLTSLLELKNPSHILVSDKPPLLGGIPQKIVRNYFEEKENITWTNSPVAFHSTLQHLGYSKTNTTDTQCNYDSFNDFVICDIHPMVGKGVFTTKALKKDTVIGIYVGLIERAIERVKISKPFRVYLLHTQKDQSAEIAYDSQQFRNVTSYVQHAPQTLSPNESHGMTANLNMLPILHNGIAMTLYVANRNIEVHEQLLINYGERYWKGKSYKLFDKFGNVL